MSETFQLNITGYYTYGSWDVLSDDGQTELQLTVNPETGVIYGGGQDNPGRFTITGVLVESDIRFIKSYRGNTSASWKYLGKKLPSAENNGITYFAGGWGSPYGSRNDGQFVFAGVIEGRTDSSCPTPLDGGIEVHGAARGDSQTLVKEETPSSPGATTGMNLSIESAVQTAASLPSTHNKISQNLIYTLDTSFIM